MPHVNVYVVAVAGDDDRPSHHPRELTRSPMGAHAISRLSSDRSTWPSR
jgi:hypothetical protein